MFIFKEVIGQATPFLHVKFVVENQPGELILVIKNNKETPKLVNYAYWPSSLALSEAQVGKVYAMAIKELYAKRML